MARRRRAATGRFAGDEFPSVSESEFAHRDVRARQRDLPVVLSVIAPCLNEQSNIDPLIDRVLAAFDALPVSAELVLVDDGSADATWERMDDRAARDARVRISQHLSNQGMVRAWQTGLATARGGLVCLIDADLQNRPEDIPRLYERFTRDDVNVVQGVRIFENAPWIRLVISRGLNVLLNVAFGMHARDNKSGFILCRRDVLFQILRHRYRYRYFQSFLGPAAKVRGFTIAEIETLHEPRRAGTSFLPRIPIGVILRLCWETLKYRVESWCERPCERSRERMVPSTPAFTLPRSA